MTDAHSWNLVLGRSLIAAAWADDELDSTERECLRDLLFRLPDLEPAEWEVLNAEIDRPLDAQARAARVDALLAQQASPDQREHGRRVLRELAARAELGPAETELIERLGAALGPAPDGAETAGLLGRLKAALERPLQWRADRLRELERRRERLESGLQDRIREEWPSDEPVPDSEELHRLASGAAILAHVVHLDHEVTEGELRAMRGALEQHWGLGPTTAELVVDLALDEAAAGLDLYPLLRDFFGRTDEDERQRFLAAVFQVAAGDGRATYDEIEEIRRIGRGLLLSHRHFIAAKLSLPRGQREL
jgi:uncharacterized tellurite resistance protein B-like protein